MGIYIFNLYKANQKSENSINELNTKINALENKLVKLKDLYVRDLIRIEDYEKDYKSYIEQLDTLTQEQEKLKNSTDNNNTDVNKLKSILRQDFLKSYNLLTRTEKRRIWLSVIDYIVIDKDYNMKLFFN